MTQNQNTINFAATTAAQQFAITGGGAHIAGPNSLDVQGAASIGSYAGLFTAPTDGLIVSGIVGMGQPSPAYTLDVFGSISALRVYSNATTIDNQSIVLAEGTNQGGFGGGAPGPNKSMSGSTTTVVVFDTAAQVNSRSLTFSGAVFDGRYVYLVPNKGQITRYDTTRSFTASTSYATFDMQSSVNSNSQRFSGAAFDGRYIYFCPNSSGLV